MKQENNQTELRSWNFLDVFNAKTYAVEHFQIKREVAESIPISFDDDGHLITFGLDEFLRPEEIWSLSNFYKTIPAGCWVYNILLDIGYPRHLFSTWRPRFYIDGQLNCSDLFKVMAPKDIYILKDIIHRRIQDALGFDPYPTQDEVKQEREYFSDHPDLTDLNRNMRSLLNSERYCDIAPKESIFVIEESSELVIELMNFVKKLCKEERKKTTREEIFEEACDVMATLMLFFVRNEYPTHDVFTYISGKYRRGVERFTNKKEV